jgi:glycerol-3-phosphate dehydrogenase
MPSVLPLGQGSTRAGAAKLWAGLLAGDALRAAAGTSRATLPRPRRISPVELRNLAPAVEPAGLRGGLLSWDGQVVDDARLVLAVARTAAGLGARVLTRCAAVTVHAGGAQLRDEFTGAELAVRARVVINATGVWADRLAPGIALRPSRGTHLVLPAARLGGLPTGIMVPLAGVRNRFVFALPAGDGRAYLGITDEPVDSVPGGDPRPDDGEVEALLRSFDEVLRTPLERADVLGTFAGLRPLLAHGPGSGSTADISRRHVVRAGDDGVLTVVGGKLTTYRRMAADAVDAAIVLAGLRAGPCVTARLPLVGAASRARLARLAAPARLVRRYGTEAPRVIAEAGGPAALDPIAPGISVTAAELAYAVRHEGALDLADLLDRRTRLGLVAPDREAARPAAERALDQESPALSGD